MSLGTRRAKAENRKLTRSHARELSPARWLACIMPAIALNVVALSMASTASDAFALTCSATESTCV